MDWTCFFGGVALGEKGVSRKQAAILRRHGIPVPFSKAKASRLINQVFEKEKIKNFAIEKRLAEEVREERLKLQLLEKELLSQKRKQREAELAELRNGQDQSKDLDLSR